MNCNELLDCIGQVQDSYIAGSVPAEKPRRESRRAVYWAAAAVLAVVLCVAGAALFSGGVPVDPNGPMAGGEYDVFSDPNVLWGGGEVKNIDSIEIPKGTVYIYDELQNLIDQATEDNKIAFDIEISGSKNEIDVGGLVINEELDRDGELTKLIEEYNQSLSKNDCFLKVNSYIMDYLEESGFRKIRNQLDDIRFQTIMEVPYDPDTETGEEYDCKIKNLLMENDEFLQVYEEYIFYYEMVMDFWLSWAVQELGCQREMLIARGFIPVYGVEEVTARDWLEDPNQWLSFGWPSNGRAETQLSQLLTFVGTTDQIYALNELISDDEVYYLFDTTNETRHMDA